MCLKEVLRRATSCVAKFEFSVEVVGGPVHKMREMEKITHFLLVLEFIYNVLASCVFGAVGQNST